MSGGFDSGFDSGFDLFVTSGITGPCSWPYTPCEPVCDALNSLPGATQSEVIAWASGMLWAATGRLFGPCPTSVLPCDSWNVLCGSCHNTYRRCGCTSVPEIWIPGPVASVVSVVVDGVTLPASAYRIDDYEWLVRLDGGTWPSNPDQLDPDGFRVDYNVGISPPAGAGIITGILACELAKVVCDDDSCRLPRRVQSVARQGVTVEFGEDGFGLPEVDNWVANALTPMLAGAVHSPDLATVRRTTWP